MKSVEGKSELKGEMQRQADADHRGDISHQEGTKGRDCQSWYMSCPHATLAASQADDWWVDSTDERLFSTTVPVAERPTGLAVLGLLSTTQYCIDNLKLML